jgi:hypothetical protein
MKKTGKNRKKTGLLHPSNSRMHKIGGSWHRPAGAKKETPPTSKITGGKGLKERLKQ